MTLQRYRLEIVTTAERLHAIEPEWHTLFAEDVRATPFQSPDWLLPWADCFAEHGSLRVIVLWSGARALLCLPLRILQRDGQRRLGWLGEGLSDYLDLLAAPDAGGVAFAAAWAALRELGSQVDRIELGDVPAHSPLLSAMPLLSSFEPGWRVQPAAVCPKLAPGSDLSAFERGLPAWLLRNVLRSQRRLEARGPLRWQRARPDDAGAQLEDLFFLHAARWRAQGQRGILDHPKVQAFHRAAAPRLLSRGLLQLEIASWAERPIAAGYTLVRRQAYLYLTGFDPGVEGVSLGSLLIARAIQRAIADGREGVDLLRGREPYKYAWGAQDTQTYRLMCSTVNDHTVPWGPAPWGPAAPSPQATRGATGSASPNNC